MRILALDTTSNFGSIAILQSDELVEQIPLHSAEGFSQTLFGHVERLLGRHEWDVRSIDCFASAAGPGSFTGVRVGLAAVKGLAEAAGRPAFAVSNLQALAACGSTGRRAVIMDARRGEVYAAVYDQDLKLLAAETVMPLAKWVASLESLPSEIISPDLTPFRASLPENITAIEERLIAAAAGRIAYRGMLAGNAPDPASLDANYVRRSDAELLWTDR
jgi:tRNA threonylcarbamoyladenosine biosynthesis protein TsaB